MQAQDDDNHDQETKKHGHKSSHRAHFGPHQIGKSPDHFREKIIKEGFENTYIGDTYDMAHVFTCCVLHVLLVF